jgi:putative membrane protein
VKFMVELRGLRAQMKQDGLVHGETAFPFSATLAVALLLFAIGLFAIASMVFRVGPFH